MYYEYIIEKQTYSWYQELRTETYVSEYVVEHKY